MLAPITAETARACGRSSRHRGSLPSGADTPRAFLERCLDELATREPASRRVRASSIIADARAAADRATARWREGKPLSPIDGMPVGIKDIIETVDMPTEMGSPLFAGWRSQKDAACVSALRQAGAVIVGKTVTTEFAASVAARHAQSAGISTTRPAARSSGSAAAVGCGMISAGLGTQVIGSTHPAGELLRRASASSRR